MTHVSQKRNLYRFLIPVALLATIVPSVCGQTNTPAPNADLNATLPEFEVASVKASNPDGRGLMGPYTYPGGKVTCGFCTLESLIMCAFDMEAFQLSGTPGWARDVLYDVEAEMPASSRSSKLAAVDSRTPFNDEQREMLQALLRDRFHLRYHRVNGTGPVYILTRGRGKLELALAKDKSVSPWVGSNVGGVINGDGIAAKNISMPVLCSRLSLYLRRPVLDETALKGNFDFQYDYANDGQLDDIVPSIVTSIQAIGLKLRTGNGPIATIVIDHVEKPSQN